MGKLQHIQHQITAINNLIKINNDRIADYENLLEGKQEYKYSKIFDEHVSDSKKNIAELVELIQALGGHPATGTTLSNKVYQTWFDIKTKIRKPDDKSILRNCVHVEEVVNAAYREALDDKELIWDDKRVVSVLSNHLKGLKSALDKIKALYTDDLPQ